MVKQVRKKSYSELIRFWDRVMQFTCVRFRNPSLAASRTSASTSVNSSDLDGTPRDDPKPCAICGFRKLMGAAFFLSQHLQVTTVAYVTKKKTPTSHGGSFSCEVID